MMGVHWAQKELFSYQVELERRVRADHPLRAIRRTVDFGFVRQEVARCYGRNGHVSADPEVVMKLMFLLFLDNVKSERELLRMLPERLDYLWFLGFGLDDVVPDHSVLSKARARWGQAVFESLFVRIVQQCVAAGLVDGTKLHLDGSLINARTSRDSVVTSSPELAVGVRLRNVSEFSTGEVGESEGDQRFRHQAKVPATRLRRPERSKREGLPLPRGKRRRSVGAMQRPTSAMDSATG